MLDFFNGQNDVGKTFPTRENAIWLTLSITSMFFQSSWTILDMWYDSSPMNIRVANWPKLDQNTKKHTQTVKAKFFLIQKKNSINRGFPGFTVSLHNFLHRRCFFFPPGDLGKFVAWNPIQLARRWINIWGFRFLQLWLSGNSQEFTWLSRSMI